MKILNLIALGLLVSVSASAGILTTTPASPAKKLEGVDIASGGTFAGQSGKLQVYTVGAALRQKYIAGPIGAKVYVAQLMVSEPGKFVRGANDALGSLNSMGAVAIQLTTRRNIPKADVNGAFAAAFSSNGIDSRDANSVAGKLLAFVNTTADWENNKTFTVVAQNLPNGSDVVTVENTAGQTVTITAPDAIRVIFSLWIGTLPATDKGLQEFKTALLSGNGI